MLPPYFASPPVAAGADLAASTLGTGVLAVLLLELLELLGFDGAAASSDPQATATISRNAVNIGRRVLKLSKLCLDM